MNASVTADLKARVHALEEMIKTMKSKINFLFAVLQQIIQCLPSSLQLQVQEMMEACEHLNSRINTMCSELFDPHSLTSTTNIAVDKEPEATQNSVENTVSTEYVSKKSDEFPNICTSTEEGKSRVPFDLSRNTRISVFAEQLDDPCSKLSERVSVTSDEGSSTSSRTSATPLIANYILPDNVTALDVIHLWKSGTKDIPPIQAWTSAQKLPQKSKISRWRKLVRIFDEKCRGDIANFTEKYSDAKGRLMSVSGILNMHSNDNSVSDTDIDLDDSVFYDTEVKAEQPKNITSWPASYTERSSSSSFPGTRKQQEKHQHSYVLPGKVNGKKITAKDVIRIWNKGIGHIPPIKDWPPGQKIRQQSKISRWKKIVDIFNEDFKGNFKDFRKRFSDSKGMLLPVSAILSIYERRNDDGSAATAEPQTSHRTAVIVSTGKNSPKYS